MSRVRETLQQQAGKQLPQGAGVHNPGNYGKPMNKPKPKKKMGYGKKR